MDDKLKKLADLKTRRQQLDDEIGKLKAEVETEMESVLGRGKGVLAASFNTVAQVTKLPPWAAKSKPALLKCCA
jgi:hypothetical protein